MVDSTNVLEYRSIALAVARDFYLPGSDREDVEQEAMVGLLKATRSYQPDLGVPFRPFAAMCVRRHLIAMLKRANSAKHQVLTNALRDPAEEEGLPLVFVASAADPQTIAEGREAALEKLRIIREEMSPLERHCLIALANGRSHQEIAQTVGGKEKVSPSGYINYPRVYNALTRARQRLAA